MARGIRELFVAHPVCGIGMAVAFLTINFRGVALDYLAYRIYDREHGRVSRGVFTTGRKVLVEYERVSGTDKYYRFPELCGVLSVLMFAVSGFALVFAGK
jgi:hypothetical protein